jgi:hypothetical protein
MYKIIGGWGKLLNEELHNLYFSPDIIRTTKLREMKWAGRVVRMGETRVARSVLVVKPEEKRLLE